MNLSTKYLGLNLRTPLVPSASPLTSNLDSIRRLEDAGASAVVLHSLFEEQIQLEQAFTEHQMAQGSESYAEALSYFPEWPKFRLDTDGYLTLIARAKAAVNIPIIASLNCSNNGGWISYARKMQDAGADALELNIYNVPTDPTVSSIEIEQGYIAILRAVKSTVRIPVAVKLSPFFTSLVRMAHHFDENGADGLVLFNRFYQPDVDIENLELTPNLLLSTPMASRLPLTWIGILFGQLRGSLAATSGIHRAADAIKMLMVGADVTMLCSVLLRRGPNQLRAIENEMVQWLEEHEYESVEQLKGSLSQRHCPNPGAFERALYVQGLSTTFEATPQS
jgi:dihydroorotate dehydrogenase (fumarate)